MKESVDLNILGVTFDAMMTFPFGFQSMPKTRSVSSRSPVECFIISCSWRDISMVLSCQFWSTVVLCGSPVPVHTFGYSTM